MKIIREKNEHRKCGIREIYNEIVDLNSNRSVITFNANESNVPIRRQKVSDWMKKI